MKRLLLTCCLLTALPATAQCFFFIQPSVTKITSDTTINNASGDYWVCLGKVLTIGNSSGSTYYMEDLSTLNVLATTGDQAILKPSCTVNNSSSGTIAVTADMTSVVLNNTGSGAITQQTDCPPGNMVDPFAPGVSFGYGGGSFYSQCYVVPLGAEDVQEKRFAVYPNPVADGVLFFDSGTVVTAVSVTDIQGKTVFECSLPGTELPVTGLANGTYFLNATLENGRTETVRFSVR